MLLKPQCWGKVNKKSLGFAGLVEGPAKDLISQRNNTYN